MMNQNKTYDGYPLEIAVSNGDSLHNAERLIVNLLYDDNICDTMKTTLIETYLAERMKYLDSQMKWDEETVMSVKAMCENIKTHIDFANTRLQQMMEESVGEEDGLVPETAYVDVDNQDLGDSTYTEIWGYLFEERKGRNLFICCSGTDFDEDGIPYRSLLCKLSLSNLDVGTFPTEIPSFLVDIKRRLSLAWKDILNIKDIKVTFKFK